MSQYPSTSRKRGWLAAAPGLLRDLIVFDGAASITYGAWLIYEPAGFITGGVLTLGLVVLSVIGADDGDDDAPAEPGDDDGETL